MATARNRSLLAWGESGSAKTSQVSYLARRIWRNHHKRTRLLNFGDGGWDACKPEIEAGLIEAWRVPYIEGKMVALCRKLSLGWWPKPTPDGKLILSAPTSATWEEFGLQAFDGLTGLSDLVFRNYQQQGIRMGNDAAPVLLSEGDADLGGIEKVYAPTQGHYNFTQKEARMLVLNASGLPLELTYWTALESKGEEQVGKDTVYGPLLVGSAQTSKCPAWFGDCFHMEPLFLAKTGPKGEPVLDPVTKTPVLVKRVRCYYNDHQDARTGMKYKAKPRVPPSLYPKLEECYPGGYFDLTPGQGIDEFLNFEDDLMATAKEGLTSIDFDPQKFQTELAARRTVVTAPVAGRPAAKV